MRKNRQLFLALSFAFCILNASAQVTCIDCFNQNAPVSNPITNLIQYGGFEAGCNADEYFCIGSAMHNCDLWGWWNTGGGPLTYARAVNNTWSFIPEGTLAAYFGTFQCNICSNIINNDTSCLTAVGCEVVGIPIGFPDNPNPGYGGDTGVSLEQYVNSLISGNYYVLEFWVGGEWDSGNFTTPGVFAVNLGWGNIFLRNNVTPSVGGIGKRYVIQFMAPNTYINIKFTNWGHACYTCTELVLDDVRLYPLSQLSPSVAPCITGIDENTSSTVRLVEPGNVIDFGTEVHAATLLLFNLLGEKVKTVSDVSGKSFELNRAHLPGGIYMVEVREKEKSIARGKIIMY